MVDTQRIFLRTEQGTTLRVPLGQTSSKLRMVKMKEALRGLLA
jgi:hypothetical protein